MTEKAAPLLDIRIQTRTGNCHPKNDLGGDEAESTPSFFVYRQGRGGNRRGERIAISTEYRRSSRPLWIPHFRCHLTAAWGENSPAKVMLSGKRDRLPFCERANGKGHPNGKRGSSHRYSLSSKIAIVSSNMMSSLRKSRPITLLDCAFEKDRTVSVYHERAPECHSSI